MSRDLQIPINKRTSLSIVYQEGESPIDRIPVDELKKIMEQKKSLEDDEIKKTASASV